jgi:hypothetical protein
MPETSRSYSAFISYASPDREKAEAICASLEARGMTCWIAPRNVRAGHEYANEIIRGIEESRCLVLLLSQAANESVFVRREVERAVSKRKPVFPFRIEEVLPSPSLELFVSATHWIDAWGGRLLDHVEKLAHDLSDESTVASITAFSRKAARRRQMPRWIIAGVAFVLAVLAIVVANDLSSRMSGSPKTPVSAAPPATSIVVAAPSRDETKEAFEDYLKVLQIDLSALRKEDFSISVSPMTAMGKVYQVDIKTPGNFAKLLGPYMKTMISLDGGPARPLYGSNDMDPNDSWKTAKTVSLSFETEFFLTHEARQVGPFEYPVVLGKGLAFRSVRSVAPQQPGVALKSLAAPAGAEPPVIYQNYDTATGKLEFTAWCGTDVQGALYAFDDAAFTELGQDRRSTRGPYFFRLQNWMAGAKLRITLKHVDGTREGPFEYECIDRKPFILAALKREFTDNLGSALLCSLIAFKYPVDTVRATPRPPAPALVAATQKSGPPAEQQAAMQAYNDEVSRLQKEAILAATAARQENSRMSNLLAQDFSFVQAAPTIACIPNPGSAAHRWVIVKEVQIGEKSGHLDRVVPVTIDAEAFWKTGEESFHLRKRQIVWMANFQIWNALLPLGTDSVYARFVFIDGTSSDEVRYPVQELKSKF